MLRRIVRAHRRSTSTSEVSCICIGVVRSQLRASVLGAGGVVRGCGRRGLAAHSVAWCLIAAWQTRPTTGDDIGNTGRTSAASLPATRWPSILVYLATVSGCGARIVVRCVIWSYSATMTLRYRQTAVVAGSAADDGWQGAIGLAVSPDSAATTRGSTPNGEFAGSAAPFPSTNACPKWRLRVHDTLQSDFTMPAAWLKSIARAWSSAI